MLRTTCKLVLTLITAGLCVAGALAQTNHQTPDGYQLNPGDVLRIFVWNEQSLTQDVLVRPDGYISLPLAGQIKAGGRTPAAVEEALSEALSRYLKDRPIVTVSLKEIGGNKVYVLGKVNRPGEYPIVRPTDVMQALSAAGGLNAFAAENDIVILRRNGDGTQEAIPFEYGEVKQGEALGSNIVLRAGDVVVVP